MAERSFERPGNRIEAAVELDGKHYSCEVIQLSFNSALLRTDAPVGRGDAVELDLDLIGGSEDLWVHLGGQVATLQDRHVGIDFWEMDLESLGALRRIISAFGEETDSQADRHQSFDSRRCRHSRDGRRQY